MINNNLYLAHHGVKGQRWGVRRYQNPDGTLTEEGKQKYAHLYNDGKLTISGAKMFKGKHAGDKVSEEEFIDKLKSKDAKKIAIGATAAAAAITLIGGASMVGGVIADDRLSYNTKVNRDKINQYMREQTEVRFVPTSDRLRESEKESSFDEKAAKRYSSSVRTSGSTFTKDMNKIKNKHYITDKDVKKAKFVTDSYIDKTEKAANDLLKSKDRKKR